MPDIQPIESDDTGVPAWVPLAVVVVILALISVPAFFLIRELTEIEIGAPPPGQASGPETAGMISITADTSLSANHSGQVVIGADNVTLDCRGFTIRGTGRETQQFGISVYRLSGVTITNCHITEVQNGILVGDSVASIFSNNTISHVNTGITLTGSANNTVSQNLVEDAGDWFGIGTFQSSSGNSFLNNRATGVRGVAFMAWQGDQNRWEANEAIDNFGIGFGANTTTSGNLFIANISSRNTGYGIEDQTSGSGDAGTGNEYEGNVCEDNRAGASSPASLCS